LQEHYKIQEGCEHMNQDIIARAGELINSKTDFIGDGMEGYAVLSLINENGYPTSSTITISKADGINWLSFLSDINSNKANRIKNCNKACVCLASSEYNITLVGTIEIITDPAVKKEHWQETFTEHYGDFTSPEFCTFRFTTESYNIFFADDYENEATGILKNTDIKAMLKVTPALGFKSQCNQAVELYKKAFGAEIVTMVRYSDADPADLQYDEHEKDFVFYGEMVIGETLITLGDDSIGMMGGKAQSQTPQSSLLLEFESLEELQTAYDIIAEGATILTPLSGTMYCSVYTVLIDKFGIRWDLMSGYEG